MLVIDGAVVVSNENFSLVEIVRKCFFFLCSIAY